ncbi:secondary thiamine-phosphate synthase enzyme YjbQ [Caldanaerobacter subterraneus]|uniref:YjbQ family protein n=1 Tax=Caldanaerobacter subterraneus TaxID=911092 RepID=A0A7Y2L7I4_9THEO|nr:secondary thiamine-phosphate synthase enzyme YjbQ [Caldanaerobacter subterraneus]NNG67243.1 YjbQ family protein [Caldanaerobacter subterraneus]
MKSIYINTPAREVMIDITREVQEEVKRSGVREGICTVFVPHTTAGITINENADPTVKEDILSALDKIIPNISFKHLEGNSDAHIKASLVGSSVTVLIENGELVLGTWQGIYFCEFDGPRKRKVYIKIIPS